jgi:hypothetical protein
MGRDHRLLDLSVGSTKRLNLNSCRQANALINPNSRLSRFRAEWWDTKRVQLQIERNALEKG